MLQATQIEVGAARGAEADVEEVRFVLFDESAYAAFEQALKTRS